LPPAGFGTIVPIAFAREVAVANKEQKRPSREAKKPKKKKSTDKKTARLASGGA
jgi:hypothetical protein